MRDQQRRRVVARDCVDFGHEKLEWLRRFVPLKSGVPSRDCIAYVFSGIPTEDFRSCFMV
ncbi:transposase family protein [Candidatus Methylospira mobilis]|uniref:Transposase family protein n=1 Tax=Candidatus Methylospira mobilis TaxID=1808979 RepID=A0A5Q0BGN3_9GAMM|nr:transposase family protein [Candidatus Methylospira mobilis]QFY41371.1 transposase family protein [Candidatus Methylospira mobilis]